MATPSPRTEHFEEDILEFVQKSEEAIVDTGRKLAKAVGTLFPEQVPMVGELVRDVFDFTEESLKLQREFARNVLERTRRVVEGTSHRVSPPAPRSRAAAAKATRSTSARSAHHSAA